MSFKSTTVFLFAEDARHVKRLHLSRWWVIPISGLLVFVLFFFTTFFPGYLFLKKQMPLTDGLKRENHMMARQLDHLIMRIRLAAKKMDELRLLDHQVRGMVQFELVNQETQGRGIGGSPPSLLSFPYGESKSCAQLVRLLHRSLDSLGHEIAAGKQDKAELQRFLEKQRLLLASTPSLWPTTGWLSSGFGYRKSPFGEKTVFHNGIDISTRRGASIAAPAAGIVSKIRYDHISGRVLCVSHGFGFKTVYAHLKSILVKEGQTVNRGDVIALVGNSGRSTGPHLHYEVHLNNLPVNPLRYVPSQQPPSEAPGIKKKG